MLSNIFAFELTGIVPNYDFESVPIPNLDNIADPFAHGSIRFILSLETICPSVY
ncbi:MAG: hypothetical protein JW384_03434 [Nitrosomonadaceae bacterium]|nr:hypothetical protein [Nitrosomonadaceae bacterium]